MGPAAKILNVGGRFPWLTGIVALAVAMIYGQPGWSEGLVFDRGQILSGQFWRLFTGNLVHFSASHLFFDLAGFCLFFALVQWRSGRQALLELLMAGFFIGVTLLFLDPNLGQYGGLSGLVVWAAGRFGWQALESLDSVYRRAGTLLIFFLIGKIGLEIGTGQAWLVSTPNDTIRVVPLAHLAGLFFAAIYILAKKNVAGGREIKIKSKITSEDQVSLFDTDGFWSSKSDSRPLRRGRP